MQAAEKIFDGEFEGVMDEDPPESRSPPKSAGRSEAKRMIVRFSLLTVDCVADAPPRRQKTRMNLTGMLGAILTWMERMMMRVRVPPL